MTFLKSIIHREYVLWCHPATWKYFKPHAVTEMLSLTQRKRYLRDNEKNLNYEITHVLFKHSK